MLPYRQVEILEYLARDGRRPYAKWFESLSAPAAAQAAVAQQRDMEDAQARWIDYKQRKVRE
jgi:hypothetical protein